MNKDILYTVLQLDSIFGFLDWTERAYIHHYRLDKLRITTAKILEACQFIKDNHWQAPEMRYMDDRLLYFQSDGKWCLIADYKKHHPEIQSIKHLKK